MTAACAKTFLFFALMSIFIFHYQLVWSKCRNIRIMYVNSSLKLIQIQIWQMRKTYILQQLLLTMHSCHAKELFKLPCDSLNDCILRARAVINFSRIFWSEIDINILLYVQELKFYYDHTSWWKNDITTQYRVEFEMNKCAVLLYAWIVTKVQKWIIIKNKVSKLSAYSCILSVSIFIGSLYKITVKQWNVLFTIKYRNIIWNNISFQILVGILWLSIKYRL